MAQTIYASFADASLAEKAAGALLDYGVRQEDMSLVTSDNYGETRVAEGRSVDPEAVDRNFRGSWATDESGYRGGVAAPDRPVVVNPGTLYAGGAGVGAAYVPPVNDETIVEEDVVEEDVVNRDDLDTNDRRSESAAKHGFSTTTPGDAGSGALKGAGWGLGLGILGIIASLAVPGVGWVVGGGALATAIGGAIGTTVGGAIAGGVTGYLKDQGVPDTVAVNYGKDIENGGALLAVYVPSNNVDAGTAEQILAKYGAANVSSY